MSGHASTNPHRVNELRPGIEHRAAQLPADERERWLIERVAELEERLERHASRTALPTRHE